MDEEEEIIEEIEEEEEDDRDFIISRIRTHKLSAMKGVIFGLIVTSVIAFIPLAMWFTESPTYPTIFSLEWWVQNEVGSVIIGTILVLLITALPIIPMIWAYRYIRADIIHSRRLKKILTNL